MGNNRLFKRNQILGWLLAVGPLAATGIRRLWRAVELGGDVQFLGSAWGWLEPRLPVLMDWFWAYGPWVLTPIGLGWLWWHAREAPEAEMRSTDKVAAQPSATGPPPDLALLDEFVDDLEIDFPYTVPERLQEWYATAAAAGTAMVDTLRILHRHALVASTDYLYNLLGLFVEERVLDRLKEASGALDGVMKGGVDSHEEMAEVTLEFLHRYASAQTWVMRLLSSGTPPNEAQANYRRLVNADSSMRDDIRRLRSRRDVSGVANAMAQVFIDHAPDRLPAVENVWKG